MPDMNEPAKRMYPPAIPLARIREIANLAVIPPDRFSGFLDEFQLLLDYASFDHLSRAERSTVEEKIKKEPKCFSTTATKLVQIIAE